MQIFDLFVLSILILYDYFSRVSRKHKVHYIHFYISPLFFITDSCFAFTIIKEKDNDSKYQRFWPCMCFLNMLIKVCRCSVVGKGRPYTKGQFPLLPLASLQMCIGMQRTRVWSVHGVEDHELHLHDSEWAHDPMF